MIVIYSLLSALLNVLILAAIPFFFYYIFHRRRHNRKFAEIAQRAGLNLGEIKYIGYALINVVGIVAILIIWPPAIEPMTREGSAWKSYVGLGLCSQSILMALMYGVIKTGFAEEFLFRGLIAGSLSRRMSFHWANIVQALVFLAPHLALLFIMPEMWHIMPLIFFGALILGWLRIKSGSIVAPWLVHASVNITMGLSIAIRTATEA